MSRVLKEQNGFVYTTTKPIHKPEYSDIQVNLNLETPKKPKPNKRASLQLRGKRTSEKYNGLAYLPHPSIPTKDYYKFIDSDASDPVRMRQLLLWCCLNTISESTTTDGPLDTKSTLEGLQQCIIQGLIDKSLSTSWYARQVNVDLKKDQSLDNDRIVHPNNAANEERVKLFELQLERFKKEKNEWQNMQQKNTEEQNEETIEYEECDIEQYVDPKVLAIVDDISKLNTMVDEFTTQVTDDILFKEHSLYHNVHQTLYIAESISKECEDIFTRMVRAVNERTKGKSVSELQVLNLLSSY